jgi:hypothetical protein
VKKKLLLILALFISGTIIALVIYHNSVTEIKISNDVIDHIIKENVEPIAGKKLYDKEPPFGGKIFCEYTEIAAEKKYGEIKVYLNIWYEEFYVESGILKKGSGGKSPAVLHLKKQNNNYLFKNVEISTELESSESIKIFPMRIRNNYDINKWNISSDADLQKRSKEYFNLH